MPKLYNTLPYSMQTIYKQLQTQLESFQTSCEFHGVSFESIAETYKAVFEDHPEYFWLSGSSAGTTITRGTSISVEFRPEYRETSSTNQLRREKTEFESKVAELIALAKRRSSNIYDQILFLHDYLVVHTDYRDNSRHCFDAYGCLIQGRAVCSGYAAAFHVLMNKLGVECGRVRGSSSSALTGEVSHVWNYIKLSDGYYFIDVTWDDDEINKNNNRNFYMVTTSELLEKDSKQHNFTQELYKEIK